MSRKDDIDNSDYIDSGDYIDDLFTQKSMEHVLNTIVERVPFGKNIWLSRCGTYPILHLLEFSWILKFEFF
jgi:hypothetical protein